MSKKKGIFSKTKQHKAPTAQETHDALKTTPPREKITKKSQNSTTMTIRTTPEWRDRFKRYAYENRITISETVKLGLMSLEDNGAPEKKTLNP